MSQFKNSFKSFYYRLFGVQEIADSLRLQVVAAAVALVYLFDMLTLSLSPLQFVSPKSPYSVRCWSHFPQCQKYIHFEAFPFSYAYTLWTAALLGFLLAALWFALHKKWGRAHFFLLVPVLWRLIFQFVLINFHTVNFDLFYLVPALVFLLTKNKLQSLKYTWALCYLFAARVKLEDSWILGTYFTSTTVGLPFVPQILTPLITNIAIFFEIICAFGLVSRSRTGNKLALIGWTLFHLFSVVNVGYVFSFRCLTFLWAIFGIPALDEKQKKLPPQRSWMTVALTLLLCLVNFIPIMIPGDVNQTFAGIDYGFHMVDANHQCLHIVRHFSADNKFISQYVSGTRDPMRRCFPDTFLQRMQEGRCQRIQIGERLEWKLWHSKNGGPFFEMVNVPDACHLRYEPFAKNDWIKEPEDGAPLIGYPERNSFYKSGESGYPPVYKYSQGEPYTYVFLKKNYQTIRQIYLFIWTLAFAYLLLEIGLKNLIIQREDEEL